MIIGFSRYGQGGSGPALDYLTGYLVSGEARDPKPEVVRGDPKAVAEIIDAVPFKCRYSSGVLSFAPEDRVTPEMQEDIMNRFENAVFAGLAPDRRSIVWIKHGDKGRTELHFVVPRVDLGTGKSLNIAPPTPASRHLLDTLREGINRRYGFRDPSDPARAQAVSVPNYVAKLAAQAKRHGRSARTDIRQAIADSLEEQARAGVIQSRADVVRYMQAQGFTITRAGVNSVTIVRPNTQERVRLKGNVFRQHFCPQDLQPAPAHNNPAQLLELDRRLERLVEKRAAFHRARYGVEQPTIEAVRTTEEPVYDRTRTTSHRSLKAVGRSASGARATTWPALERLDHAARGWREAHRQLDHAGEFFVRTDRAFAGGFERTLTGLERKRAVRSLFQRFGVPTGPGANSRERSLGLEPEIEMPFPLV